MAPVFFSLQASCRAGRRQIRRCLRCCAAAFGLMLLPAAMAVDEAPVAVASIKPLHSLLAGVMAGIAEPHVLVRGGASPHIYSLKPSDAITLGRADLVVWVGTNLEAFLAQPIAALTDDARVLELSRAESLSLLRNRQGGLWEDDEHHGHEAGHCREHHGKEHHGKHYAEKHHHAEHYAEGHHGEECCAERHHQEEEKHECRVDGHHEDEAAGAPHADGHAHDHGIRDMHVWLDPENAAAITRLMAAALAEIDPPHAARYRANAEQLKTRLHALDAELHEILAPVADRGFIVFHDAWQYFDTHYGLRALGSITVSPEQAPGAARLVAIREKIADADAACVFSEPQFQPRIVHSLIADTGIATGELDVLGATLEAGPELYFRMMRSNAQAMRACLQP